MKKINNHFLPLNKEILEILNHFRQKYLQLMSQIKIKNEKSILSLIFYIKH